ncbi:MAG TPA: molybdate ABC transporter substrate-binding protein [Nitrospira sp.]|nr:molybdate ABC transporter substrate-binding protein [Nitrospira sp.]
MSMFRTAVCVTGLAGAVAMIGPQTAGAETLTVGASYSLKPAFQKIVPMFEREYGASVQVTYGSSRALRRGIEQGSPIDVFLPGPVEEVETLHKKGLTLGKGVQVYARTSLVLVMSEASRTTSASFNDSLPDRTVRLAIGDPKTSSLGELSERVLAKMYPGYKRRFQLIHAPHSEEILDLLRGGQADMGLLYRVDALNHGQLWIVDEVSTENHKNQTPVLFGQAMVATCREESRKVAEDFLDFMMSPRIQKLLVQYGFDPIMSRGTGTTG